MPIIMGSTLVASVEKARITGLLFALPPRLDIEKCWYPTGVAIDSEMNVIVVDCESHRVLKFSPDRTFLASSRKLMERGSEVGEFNRPVHIKILPWQTMETCMSDRQIV